MGSVIDLRSDTVTVPTPAMRKAMYEAEVGDDVYGEDPTICRLEEMAARRLGKEAGLFVTSGTMGNLVSILTHTRPGNEIILEAESHIFYYEVGGCAALGGVMVRTVPGERGAIDPKRLEDVIRGQDIHFPPTALIALENTHNRAGGAVIPLEKIKAVREVADKYGIPMHLDGARIFNAAIALGVPAGEIARYFDSVMFCLSKGLAAPVGSVIVGTRDWIARARKWRKMVGGGMRQAGILAAAGIVALEQMVDRLAEDHANAELLATGLAEIHGLKVNPAEVETNMVRLDVAATGMTGEEFCAELKLRGVLASPFDPTIVRLVTHKDVSRSDMEKTLEVVSQMVV
ncbi:MAG: low-specificity L-threonine aldolase [bacterium]|jgi:threonine aldolase